MIKKVLWLFFFSFSVSYGETVRVATYNLWNYLVMDRRLSDHTWRSAPKPESQKEAVCKVIVSANPDILLVQEIGGWSDLCDLQRKLFQNGLDYPHIFLAQGSDPTRFNGLLSKIPWKQAETIDDLTYNYFGQTLTVKRGLLKVQFLTAKIDWYFYGLHLKSKWSSNKKDPLSAKQRKSEAMKVREYIYKKHQGKGYYLIAGDFNDTVNMPVLRYFLNRGDTTLSEVIPVMDSKGLIWTHFYRKAGIYSQIDFLLASPLLLQKTFRTSGEIVDLPISWQASDHRLVYVDLYF